MGRVIAQRDLRNDNAKVIDDVVAGETFIVTRNGVPVAELRPFSARRRRFVAREDLAALAAGAPGIDQDGFRADLDAVVDQALQ